ncbi:MAG: hypothetical protein A2X84_09585 [Desulfuromonadaceae bacterium GWC2_58_13]|nr:MAG: hypothetical protein A2X84_09585 [Desulfuromonadaceae bacterium GWC2_58_13]
MFGVGAKIIKALLFGYSNNIRWTIFLAFNFFFYPIFFVDGLSKFCIWIYKFNYFVGLPRSIYQLLFEQKSIRIFRTVILIVV